MPATLSIAALCLLLDAAQAAGAPAEPVRMDFVDVTLSELAAYVAEATGRNLLLGSGLDEVRVSVLVAEPVSPQQAYDIFLSVLESEGYTAITVHAVTKIVRLEAAGR